MAYAYAAELTDAVNKTSAIRRLATNVSMITALAVVYWNERKLPQQRAMLLASMISAFVRARQRVDRIEDAQCLQILAELAFAMQSRSGGRVRQLSIAEAAAVLAPRFSPDSRHGRSRTDGEGERQAIAFLEAEMIDSGIVVRRDKSLEFCHLAMQEFLTARHCAGLSDHELKGSIFKDNRVYAPEWREVILLLGGLLASESPHRLKMLYRAILDRVRTPRGQPPLERKAHAVGIIGAILRELVPLSRKPRDKRYAAYLADTLKGFEQESSESLPLTTKIEAANAWGQATDPRLRDPSSR